MGGLASLALGWIDQRASSIESVNPGVAPTKPDAISASADGERGVTTTLMAGHGLAEKALQPDA